TLVDAEGHCLAADQQGEQALPSIHEDAATEVDDVALQGIEHDIEHLASLAQLRLNLEVVQAGELRHDVRDLVFLRQPFDDRLGVLGHDGQVRGDLPRGHAHGAEPLAGEVHPPAFDAFATGSNGDV